MDDKSVVRVEIFGTSYTIRGEEDRGYIERIAEYVDGKMRALQEKLPVASLAKVAVLTSLHLADELFKERQDRDDLSSFVQERASQLACSLEEVLQES